MNGSDKILPNVSYCENENEVHYNPWTDPRLIAKFNVTNVESAISILYNNSNIISAITDIEIDGVVQPNVASSYTFDTTGEHSVKYTLSDPTTIPYYYVHTQYADISYGMFKDCSYLTIITIPNSVTIIGGSVFENCNNLTNITIPDSVTSIGYSAFKNCTGLTSITIPDSVTSISGYAFSSCTGLTSVTIGNGVTSIDMGAFIGCSSLTNIRLGNNVTSIGTGVFNNCTGLTSITIQATTPPTLSNSNAFNNTNDCPIYVPSASVEAYKAATNWSSLASRIQAIP